jgi:hypothetical protein
LCCRELYLGARFFAAIVPLLQAARLAAIGGGGMKNDAAVRCVSRNGDRRELLKGPLIYCGVVTAITALHWRTSISVGSHAHRLDQGLVV